jgi:wyosine [tRNA(Phe)-imidazoG37] synthetase (radical SAM superfamily)
VKGAPPLPFFSYTAVSFQGDGFHVPAIFLEDDFRWSPSQYDGRELKGNVERMLKTHPSNRLMRHLSRCALDYHCYTAQNIFYNRWEGGIPTSSACNASCYGCLSCQESDELTSPQERIGFTPTVDEILEIAVPHLESESAIVSFGQGCEGEPSLLGDLLEEAIRAIRARTAGGTLHLNSNGSRPEILARLFDAGLDSIRVSINSALADDYERYFRPRGYGFDDVLKTLSYAKERGRHISLNLLTLPGFTDREDQIEAVVSLIRTYGIHKVQLRDLNGDPDILYSVLAAKGPERRKVVGIAEMIDRLRREIPRLAVGCFNPSHLPAAACASQRSDLQTGGGPTSR